MIKSDLSVHIQSTVLIDTHEHLCSESDMTVGGPDILQDLFNWYTIADLKAAGALQATIDHLTDKKNPDLRARFNGIKNAWERSKHTGYGEATRLVARHVYGIEEITADAIEAAAPKTEALRKPGERKRILKDIGNIDHVQIDNFCWPCLPDLSGVDFFLYDLSWMSFTCGEIDAAAIQRETGMQVKDLATLSESMAALFAKYGPYAIAVKSQAAYQRTLLWQERGEADVARALNKTLNGLSVDQVLDRLRQVGQVSETTQPAPDRPWVFGMYLAGRWYRLELAADSINAGDPIKSLDAELLYERILQPILGLGDIRADPRIDFVGGIRGTAELKRRVDSGEMAIGFALYPVRIEQVMLVSDGGGIMPPKTTWFEPKLKSGLFVHTLD